MTDSKKTEVNLEVCRGFFRIPTNDIVYNITVLDSHETSTTRVMEKIIEVEKVQEPATAAPPLPTPVQPASVAAPSLADSYYQQAALRCSEELSQLAAAADPSAERASNAEAGLADLAEMAGDLKQILLRLKETAADPPAAEQGANSGHDLAGSLKELAIKITQAVTINQGAAGDLTAAGPKAPEPAPPAVQTIKRYLFDLDALFQTMYELCTNETVKTHIQSARQKLGVIFKAEVFFDAISPKVKNYSEDDGFLNVPMTDVYQCLAQACSDKTIVNLLKKMDKQQGEIFLDQFLPLAVPPTEEIEVAVETTAKPAITEAAPLSLEKAELATLLQACKKQADQLAAQAEAQGGGGHDLIDSLNDAINIVSSIGYDASKLADGVSLDGLDSPAEKLWQKIKETSLFVTALVQAKEGDPTLSFAAGIAAGNSAVAACRQEVADQRQASAAAAKQAEAGPAGADAADSGEASQDDIDRLLAEMSDE